MSNPTNDYSYQLAPTNQQLGHIAGEYGWPFLGKTIAIFAELIRQCRFNFVRENYFPTRLQHFPFAKPLDDLPLLIRAR